MDETDIMDLTHQKTRKRPRPISSVDLSVHASLKRIPLRTGECRDPAFMFTVRGDNIPAASLKQNDHSVSTSPTAVMPAQVIDKSGTVYCLKQIGFRQVVCWTRHFSAFCVHAWLLGNSPYILKKCTWF